MVAALGLSACGGGGSSDAGSTRTPPAGQAPEMTIIPAANRAPEAAGAVPAQALTEGGAAGSVDVAARFEDPDGDALAYAAQSGDPGILTVGVSGSTVTLTPVSAGTATVTVTASDGRAETELSFDVTVAAANRAPEAVGSVPAVTLTEGGTARSLDVTPWFVDPDSDPLTHSAASGDPGVVTAAMSGSTVTLAPVSAGRATVTVAASDGEAEAVQEFAVTVRQRQSVRPPTSSPPASNPSSGLRTCRAGLQFNRHNRRCIAEMPFYSFSISESHAGSGVWVGIFSGARRAGYSGGPACLSVNGFVATRSGDSETWTIRAVTGSSTCSDYGF